MRMVAWRETGLAKAGLFTHFASFCSIAGFLVFIYEKLGFKDNDALIWALTFTGFLTVFFMLFNYCVYAQGVLHDEVKRCAAAKSKLEDSLLKKRRSTRGKRS